MKTIDLIKVLSLTSSFIALSLLEACHDPIEGITKFYSNRQAEWNLNTKEMQPLVNAMNSYIKNIPTKNVIDPTFLGELKEQLNLKSIDGDEVYCLLMTKSGLSFIVDFVCHLYARSQFKELKIASKLFYDIPPFFEETELKLLLVLINLAYHDRHYDIVIDFFTWLKQWILQGKESVDKSIFAMSGIQELFNPKDPDDIKGWINCVYNLSDRVLLEGFQNSKSDYTYKNPMQIYNLLQFLKKDPRDAELLNELSDQLKKTCLLFSDINRGYSYTFVFENNKTSLNFHSFMSYEESARLLLDFIIETKLPYYHTWKLVECFLNCPSQGFLSVIFYGSNPSEVLSINLACAPIINCFIKERQPAVLEINCNEKNCSIPIIINKEPVGRQLIDFNVKVFFTVPSWQKGENTWGIKVDPSSKVTLSEGDSFTPIAW